jgi:MATE family multidrug resistance protein
MTTSRQTAEPKPHRAELGAMARLATPIVLTQLAWVAMLTTDTAMIGRLGQEKLAGASLGIMMFFLAWVFCFGIVMATAALAAQAYGARKPRIVRRVVRQGLWVTIVVTAPFLVLFAFTTELMTLLDQPAEAIPHAEAYMTALMWSLPPSIGFTVLRNFVSALSRPMGPLLVMGTGVPLNALLDYGLIFGNFGLPRLELLGAGIATAAINWTMFLALAGIAAWKRPFRTYAVFGRFWRADWRQFREIFRIGMPIAGQSLLEAGFFIGSVFIAGQFGTVTIAATMVAMQLPHVTFMVPMGIAQAATVRVGQAAGRRDIDAVYRAGWTALAIGGLYLSLTTATVLLVPEGFASLFLDTTRADSAEVLALASTFLLYAAFFQAGDCIQAVAAGALRGLNDTAVPMAIAGFSYWGVGLCSGLLFAFWFDMKGAGLWAGFVVGLTTAAILLTLRWRGQHRRRYLPEEVAETI